MNAGKAWQPCPHPNPMIDFLAILHETKFDVCSLEGIIKALSQRSGTFLVISFSQIKRRIKKLPLNLKPK